MQIKLFSFRQIQFPHLNRIIAAPLLKEYILSFFWLLFVALILINIFSFSFFPQDTEKRLTLHLLTSPADKNLHEKLGEYFLPFSVERAKEEYLLAQEFYTMPPSTSPSVLGEQAPPEKKWEHIQTEKERYEEQIRLWELVHQAFPDYTHAWIKLAVLYHQLDKDAQSQKYIQKLEEEKPYNLTVINLIRSLKSTKEG